MTGLSDDALRALIQTDADAGWRAFIDQYTPMLIGLLRRAGLDDRDEVMDVYVTVCERLSANGMERLKRQDVARGSIGGWLTVLARNAVVDWIRSRKGRRRLFQAIRDLDAFDRRVFELYYWDERSPSEIADIQRAPVGDVFSALERISSRLTDRHRAELLSLAVRSKAPLTLDESDAAETVTDGRIDAETAMRIAQLNATVESALQQLPPEDAAIVRLKYVEGVTNGAIERALGLHGLTASRMQDILTRLRAALERRGVGVADVPLAAAIDGGGA